MKTGNKGFTLIELLVVIAIIGILATVSLAMLSGARNKGADGKIKATLANARSRAELYNTTNNNNYGGTVNNNCNAGMFNDNASGVDQTLESLSGGATSATCYSTNNTYAISAPLPGAGGHWCVDSTGAAKARATPINSTSC